MNRPIQSFDAPLGARLRLGKVGRRALDVVLVWFGAVGWLMLVPGCATAGPAPVRVSASAPGTHLVVVNLTNYAWRIAIVSPTGDESFAEKIQPQASVQINLRGGDYLIEQTVVTETAGPELSRRIPARLEPGQTYRWPLVTLLSGSSGDSGGDQPEQRRHE